MSDEDTTEAIEVLTAFFVVVDKSGTVGVYTSALPPVTIQREATLADLEAFGSQLSREAGRLLMYRMLAPEPEPSIADKVAEALSKRGEED